MSDPDIRAIIGLGNPGAKYDNTRHNVGFWFVDALAHTAMASLHEERKLHGVTARIELAGKRVHLLKPATYMNESGRAVQALAAYFKLAPDALLVVHDDLDLPPGTARLKFGGGHGGHNGLRDITRHLGPDFARLRLGIGHPGHRDGVLGYVLSAFTPDQEDAVFDAFDRSREALDTFMRAGWQKGVQQLHTE
jgi:PTH1 family peptidyl-tRNA hydrolase